MAKRRKQRKQKRGAGLWDTIKDSKIISGAASHIPFLGPIAGSLLGAFGLGHGARIMPYRGMGATSGRIDGSIGVSNVGRVKF